MFGLAVNYAAGDAKRFKGIGAMPLSNTRLDLGNCFINYFGDAIDPCFNIIHYSCAPNMVLHAYNGQIVWVVHYPIKAKEWLTVAFNNTTFSEKSQSEWDRVIASIITPIYIIRYTSEDAIEKFNEFCREINKKAKPLGKKCDDNVWYDVSRFRWDFLCIGAV